MKKIRYGFVRPVRRRIRKGSLWEDENKFFNNIFKVTKVKGNRIYGGYLDDGKWWEDPPREVIVQRKTFDREDFVGMVLLAE